MASNGNEPKVTPAYISWKSLKRFFTDLNKTAIPPKIDRSVMNKMSGSVQSQVRTSLRFLGLTNDDDEVSDEMRELIEAVGTDGWVPKLRAVLENAYDPILDGVDVQSGTAQQLHDAFRKRTDVQGATFRKAVRFYLKAAKEAEIKISPHFAAPSSPPRSTTRTKASSNGGKDTKGKPSAGGGDKSTEPRDSDRTTTPFWELLLAKIPEFDPEWETEAQEKYFEALERVAEMKAKES